MWRIVLITSTLLWCNEPATKQDNCLFKNPLCFYNTDVLKYLQILHKNQQYEQMSRFFYSNEPGFNKRYVVEKKLENTDFGYALKRVGIKNISSKKWSLTYQRTILGTNENFKIDCTLINDTCKVALDKNTFDKLFKNQ
jgi:hypothetical protein